MVLKFIAEFPQQLQQDRISRNVKYKKILYKHIQISISLLHCEIHLLYLTLNFTDILLFRIYNFSPKYTLPQYVFSMSDISKFNRHLKLIVENYFSKRNENVLQAQVFQEAY